MLAVVRELKEAVVGSRASNLYQVDEHTVLFRLHKADNPDLRLVLTAGKCIHLTSYIMEKPLTPPAFCMALRKFLRNSRLVNVDQYEFERVVVFYFKTKDGVLRLILELFGDGNIILVSANGTVLQALTYKRMRDRNILRGEAFAFAPSVGKNPFKVSQEELRDGLKSFGDVEVVRAVARFLSIGGVYAEEVLLRAGIEKTKPSNTLSEAESSAFFDALQNLLSHVMRCKLEPRVVIDEVGSLVDVIPFMLKRYENVRAQFLPYDSFNEALDEFYSRVVATEKAMAGLEVDGLKREAERLKRIIAEQEKVLAEAEAKAEHDRHLGDLIYAHIGDIQALLDRFSNGRQLGKEWKAIVSEVLTEKNAGLKPSVLFESFDPRTLAVNVCVDGFAFGLDLRKTVYENASAFYEQAKRAKQKLAGVKTALDDSQKKLIETESKLREAETLEQAKPTEAVGELVKLKVKHKEWFEKFRWFVSSDGFLIVAGKDAVSNEVLVKKHTEESDVVFHADIVGAPFVVVKTGGKKPSNQCLREAGEFAASLSRGWREGFGSVDVYWIKPEQLSKGGPSGESVARGAFVVRGERNWTRGTPLKLAIGVVLGEKGTFQFVGGPVEAVKARTNVYIVVVPGDRSGKELFKYVLRVLSEKMPKELREKVLKASVEEVRDFIPYGKGTVL